MTAQRGVFALFLLLLVIQATAKQPYKLSYNTLALLKSLSSSNKPPIIVVIDPTKIETQKPELNVNDLATDGRVRGSGSASNDEDSKEVAKKMLFNYLRSSPYDSPREVERKQSLREALRMRCYKITTCVEECPKRKPKCPKKCEDKFDKEELCPKRGKTMPPSWLL